MMEKACAVEIYAVGLKSIDDVTRISTVAEAGVEALIVTEMSENIGVEPILPLGDFKVRGTVRYVSFPSEPVGNRITFVQAGDADFCLALQDIGDSRPETGTTVEFIVHDLSMWDEAL